ncbi:hypothetical protein SSX86_024201 [Deinandra increscens subsp. villosa]|uniref:Myb-like domain-containing protein n=1 Tax=Deinandra increscens subsp. villosa TaxID=3103831 RepID=A0AAP0CMD9_9ASTR
MDWTENQQCVLCEKGGNLLVCSDDGCPISVHKDCMGCEAHFDDAGNFHCPYCLYKQYTAEASRLRSKVMLTKKALSIFLETKTRDDNHQEPIVEMASKEGETSSKDKVVDENHSVSLENHDEIYDSLLPEKTNEFFNRNEGVHGASKEDKTSSKDKVVDENHNVSLEHHDEIHDSLLPEKTNEVFNQNKGVHGASKEDETSSKNKVVDENHNVSLENRDETHDSLVSEKTNEVCNRNEGVRDVNTCRMMVVYKPNSDHVRKRIKSDPQTGNAKCKFKVDDQAKQSKSADIWLTLDDQSPLKRRNKSVRFNMNGRKEEPVNGANKESDQLAMANRLELKNKRCLWSEQEEEMLKEGVQKYSALTKKNLPWKKILEFGRHVFDSSRSASDLKDKWRKMAK